MMLEVAGHEVFEAGDGTQALKTALACRPEIIMADLNLPGVDGLEIIAALKKTPFLRGTRIVAMTSYPDIYWKHQAEAAGSDAFLTKPFSPERLFQLIRELARPNRAA